MGALSLLLKARNILTPTTIPILEKLEFGN